MSDCDGVVVKWNYKQRELELRERKMQNTNAKNVLVVCGLWMGVNERNLRFARAAFGFRL